jgi:hypothetical protein
VAGRVKGTLFVDYVRMLRGTKGVDWSKHVPPEDMVYLRYRILPTEWYPMEVFERLGLAILNVIAKNDLQAVEAWGRFSLDELRRIHPDLVVENYPVESLVRFQKLRSSFFDFSAIEIIGIRMGEARIRIDYGMGSKAEEAAAHQTLGFFERLLECSGASSCQARFKSKNWAGDMTTILLLDWR